MYLSINILLQQRFYEQLLTRWILFLQWFSVWRATIQHISHQPSELILAKITSLTLLITLASKNSEERFAVCNFLFKLCLINHLKINSINSGVGRPLWITFILTTIGSNIHSQWWDAKITPWILAQAFKVSLITNSSLVLLFKDLCIWCSETVIIYLILQCISECI